jgi:hypothetical protein
VLDNPLCHGLLCDSTYMLLVEVNNPLHSVLVVSSCDTLLVLCLIQILCFLILQLCIHLELLMVCCTEVSRYTPRGYTVDAHYCIATAHCCTVVAHYCMVVVPG